MLLWQWQRLKPRCVHPQPAYTLPSLTAQLWMSLYKITLKFFLNSRVLFLFPTKLSSALTLLPVFQNGTTTLYLTLKQHKGKGGEWRKERKKRKGKLWENFFFFLFLSLYQLSIKILPQWNSTYASFFISLFFAALSFHCNTIKYVFFGKKNFDRDVYYLSTLCQFLVFNEKSDLFKDSKFNSISKRAEKRTHKTFKI